MNLRDKDFGYAWIPLLVILAALLAYIYHGPAADASTPAPGTVYQCTDPSGCWAFNLRSGKREWFYPGKCVDTGSVEVYGEDGWKPVD